MDGIAGSWLPPRNLDDPVSGFMAAGRARTNSYDDNNDDIDLARMMDSGSEEDTAHLTNPSNQSPISGSSSQEAPRRSRLSSQSVRFAPGSSLGDDLSSAEAGMSRSMSTRTGTRSRSGSTTDRLSPSRSTSVSRRTLSPGSSPVRRVSVALQNMSQRVVNLSNDPTAIEEGVRRRASERSTGPSSRRRSSQIPEIEVTGEGEDEIRGRLTEKSTPIMPRKPSGDRKWHKDSNPLKGNALGIFAPSNPLRLFFCDVLIHPYVYIIVKTWYS